MTEANYPRSHTVNVPGTNYRIVGIAVQGNPRTRISVSITWPRAVNLDISAAISFLESMNRVLSWAEGQTGKEKERGTSGPMIESDGITYLRRVLFLENDTLFGGISRRPLLFNIAYTSPVIWIDGATRDHETVANVARTLGELIEDANLWKK